MKFLALFNGGEGGCDYTIGCNKTWSFIEADSIADARTVVERRLRSYGPPDGECAPEKVTLIKIESREEFDVKGYWNEVKSKAKKKKEEKELADRKALYEKLKEEFNGGNS